MTTQEILDNLGNLSHEDCQTLHSALNERLGLYLGGWGVDDLTENYLMTEEQAREWLDDNEMELSEASCSGGWDYIRDNIDYPDLDECEDCPSCGELLYWGWRLDADPESNEWVKADEDWVCKACAAKHDAKDAEGSDNSSA